MMLTLKFHWLVWLLIVVVIYMAFKSPAVLGHIIASIGHLIVVVIVGIAHAVTAAVG
jgi:hypothetical protein